jgi:serine/threonine-protein kinase
MGDVYRARDTRLDRTVAIKVLTPNVAADAELRVRFEREARAIAALDHPHICAVFDVGHHDELHYLVMQHLEGETLAARLDRTKGPLPLAQMLKIAIEIADALATTHQAGITHRDLKPGNIMLTKTGAKLLDFGLAKLRASVAPISMSGMSRLATANPITTQGTILGTVHYMAPEQAEGKEADARSDIWALGAVIYEMATAAKPFSGETAASVIGSILKDEPPPLSARQPSIPPMLDRLVARCLAKDPHDRWQSAADLHASLTWIADGVLAPARAPGPRTLTRVRLLTGAIGALLLLALVATIPGWTAHMREGLPETLRLSVLPPPNMSFSMPPASVVAPQLAISPDGRLLAFVAESPRGRPGLWIRPLDRVNTRLEETPSPITVVLNWTAGLDE